MTASGKVGQDLVRAAWLQYALPRFGHESAKERKALEQFNITSFEWHMAFNKQARNAGAKLDFDVDRLRLAVLRTLDAPCLYCSKYFGIETYGITFLSPPNRWIDHDARAFSLGNRAVCCLTCCVAKGDASAAEWIEFMAALNACDERAANSMLNAILAGRGRTDLQRQMFPPRGRYAAASPQ